MTPYLEATAALRYCTTHAALAHAWRDIQPILRGMEQGSRLSIIAMKDFYKRMIEKGTIHDYVEKRRAAAREWEAKQI